MQETHQTTQYLQFLEETVLSMPYCPGQVAAEASLYTSPPREPPQTLPWEMHPCNIPLQTARHSTFSLFGAILYRFPARIFMPPSGPSGSHRLVSPVCFSIHDAEDAEAAEARALDNWVFLIRFPSLWQRALIPHTLTTHPHQACSASMRPEELAKAAATELKEQPPGDMPG